MMGITILLSVNRGYFNESSRGLISWPLELLHKYLEEQLKDPKFAALFERAGEAWDVALQIAALRQDAGLSRKDLAKHETMEE